ncbi:MAG: glycerol-3-phosphate 1-O-acyltransferase PlsY [Acholeplasmataceae bacterium]|nr:glycerol-3-phosphate 1-O-acyltransferase PlsY [Acholeplasmataceae bacterium]
MTVYYIFLLMILSYLLGSIPSGLLIGKIFKKIDIREHGSKNTGATNAIRVLGFRYGVFAFIFDVLKGAIVIAIVALLKDESLYLIGTQQINIASLYGMVAVLGHVFPVYIHFRGGKAVATSAGMILAIEPYVILGAFVLFLVIFYTTRYVSLSSMIAAASILLYFFIRVFFEHPSYNLATRIIDFFVIVILASIIFIRHKSNYQRLKAGTENRF